MTYTFKASEMGWDWLIEATGEDMTIECNREPANDDEWMKLANWLEETFPLTNEEVSHGFSNGRAKYIFDDISVDDETWDEAYEEFRNIVRLTSGINGAEYTTNDGYNYVIWIDENDDAPTSDNPLIKIEALEDERHHEHENNYKVRVFLPNAE